MKYTLICRGSDGELLKSQFTEATADEVVRHFFYFLRGVSFHKDSILNAFQAIVDEYSEEEDKEDNE